MKISEKIILNFERVFFDFYKNVRPFGKTDMSAVYNEIKDQNLIPKDGIVLWVTDADNFPMEEEYPVPMVVASFAHDTQNTLRAAAELSGGFYQKMFHHPPRMVEGPDFWAQWNSLRGAISSELESPVWPQFVAGTTQADFPFFVTRVANPNSIPYTPAAHFIPRVWAQWRVSELLGQDIDQNEIIDALLSISYNYGVKTDFFDWNTTREDAQKNIQEGTDSAIFLTRHQLKTWQKPPTQTRFVSDVPFYQNPESKAWYSYNFPYTATPENIVKIAPFSDAQKNLFVRFPEFFAAPFSVNDRVDFCETFRCFSLRDSHRTDPRLDDIAFFRDFNPDHWANGYLIKAVNLGLVSPHKNGKLHADRGIDRGEFIRLIDDYFFNLRVSDYRESTPAFSDVSLDDEIFPILQFLSNRGVIRGFEDQTFRPKQNLSRVEAVKILVAIGGYEPSVLETQTSSYIDVHDWAIPWVEAGLQQGLIKIDETQKFNPGRDLTLAEALKMILDYSIE